MPENVERGQLAVATELQTKVAPNVSGGASVPDNGAAQAFDGFAGEMRRLSSHIGGWADDAARREGAQQGELAGLDPEFRPSRSLTIRGEAFDKAGLGIMQAKLKQGIFADFEGIADKVDHDPRAVSAAIDAKRSGWMQNVPDELKAEMTLFIDGKRQSAVRQAIRVQRANFVAEQHAAAHQEFTLETKSAQQQAFHDGLDAGADDSLAERLGAMSKILQRHGADGKPLFSPTERVKAIEGMRQEIAEARTMGAFSRLPDLESKRKFIDERIQDYSNSTGTSAVFTRDQFHRLTNEMEREYTRAKMEGRVEAMGLKQAVDGALKMAEKGFAPPASDLATIQSRVAALKDPKLEQEFADTAIAFTWMRRAAVMTPAELDAHNKELRDEMRTNGTTPRGLKVLEHSESLLNHMQTQLKTDPLGWADTSGLRKLTPLDVSSPAALAQTLRTRVADAEAVAQHYGRQPDYLRPDDQAGLAAVIAQGGTRALEVTAAIAAAAPAQKEKIMGEVGKHGPAVGMLGQLALDTGATKAVKDASDGFALLRTPDYASVVAKLPASQTLALIDTATEGVFASQPTKQAALATLANAIYEKRAFLERKTTFDPSLYSAAVAAALGENTVEGKTYGGVVQHSHFWNSSVPIVLPPFVRKDTYDQTIRMITPADLEAAKLAKPVGSDGKEVAWNRVANGTLVQVEDGRYAVALGNARSAGHEQFVRSSADKSKPFVIDLRALRPLLQKRRPDLFLAER